MSVNNESPFSRLFETLFENVDDAIGVNDNERIRRLRRNGFGPRGPWHDTHATRRQRSYGSQVPRGSSFSRDQRFAMRDPPSEEERQHESEEPMSTAGKVLLGLGLAGAVGFGLYKLGSSWLEEQDRQNRERTAGSNTEAHTESETEEAWARSMIDREKVAKKERENMARAEAIRAQAEHDEKLRGEQKLIEAGDGVESDGEELSFDDDDISEIGLYDSRECLDEEN